MPRDIIQLNVDSEFQSLIPPLSEDEYQRLERSILAEGVRDPIITWDGTIIDGHNRYRICQEHGIEFKTFSRSFASRDAAKIWIIENQFARRNLSTYDRGVLALQLEPLYQAEAKRRMSEGGGDKRSGAYQESGSQNSDTPITPIRTDDQLAKLAGTSRDTLRKVKVIETEAEGGNETAVAAREAVRSGKKSIHRAYTEVRPKGDESDARMICVVCGEPIDDGDFYDRDRHKHKSCAYSDEKGRKPSRRVRLADDGRRICTFCGEPIDEGDYYESHPSMHKKCCNERASMRQYSFPDKSLLENEATYTIESLASELLSSWEAMRDAVTESIAINESMGGTLTKFQKRRIDKAMGSMLTAIKKIMEETNNG